MATISPFRALHYNTQSISNLSNVVIPPYDNIPPGDDQKYWDRSPYNFAHILLPHSADENYKRASQLLKNWRETQIVQETAAPNFFLYQQSFTVDGTLHRRNTLMCTVLVGEYSERNVRPHENTYGKAKKDRLQIMRQTQCNLSHVFAMVKDPEGILSGLYEQWMFQPPFLKGATDEGVEHTVWKVESAKAQGLVSFFQDKPIYIVDGHHRYESSVNYAKELGVLGKKDHPAAYMLFAIANTYDPALVVLPTHRIVKHLPVENLRKQDIEEAFELLPLSFDALRAFTKKAQKGPHFALCLRGELFLCIPRQWRQQEATLGKALSQLAVVWSDQKFLPDLCKIGDKERAERLSYEKDVDKLWARRNEIDLAIFHAPVPIEAVTEVADENKFMPQKSTYFYPKLAAGFIFRDISGRT